MTRSKKKKIKMANFLLYQKLAIFFICRYSTELFQKLIATDYLLMNFLPFWIAMPLKLLFTR